MGANPIGAGERATAMAARAILRLRPLVAFVRPDIGTAIESRVKAVDRLIEWGEARDDRPLLWLHGSSAGELLGAVPAVEELRRRMDLMVLATHFSPSGETVLQRLEPDMADVLPLDLPESNDRVVAALRPDLMVFAKLDVWPGVVASVRRAGGRTALVNGVVRGGSSRMRPLSRRLFRSMYAALDAAGAATDDDATRLARLGVRPEALSVTGDAAFDLARARIRSARERGGLTETFERRLPRRPEVGRRLVAGSTWEADETTLLESIGGLPATPVGRFGWQVVLAPHKPTEAHVRRLVGECRRRGQPVATWSDEAGLADLPAHGVVVFDEMGTLAELYSVGDVAYVGGGLGPDGLHNVLEPAAAGIPVVFGPRHDRGDATGLIAAGGAFACPPAELRARLESLVDEAARESAGHAALGFVEAGCGAAETTADLLESLLSKRAGC